MNARYAEIERMAKKIEWVEAVLCNDDNSSDEELTNFFMIEGGLDRETISLIIAQRQKALVDMNFSLTNLKGMKL